MSADDVVYTFKQLSDPHNASNALSTLGGILTPDGVTKVDAGTVRFELHGPNGNFPYLVSSDNYNAIIVPAGTDYAKWPKTWIGTGAFKYVSYSAQNGAVVRPQPRLLGPQAPAGPDEVHLLRQPAAPDPGAAGRGCRSDRRNRPPGRGGDPVRQPVPVVRAQVVRPPRDLDAHRPGAVQRRPGAPRPGADARPAGDDLEPDGPATRCSATTARSRPSSRPRT